MFNNQIAEIPVGIGGLTGSKNQSKIPPNQLLTATNVSYDTGNLSKEGGSIRYNDVGITDLPKVFGGYDWWPSEGVQRMIVVTQDGKIYRDDGAGSFGTVMKTGLTLSPIPYFAEGGKELAANNRKLFIFTGLNPVQVINGDAATTTNLAVPPADWAPATSPTFGMVHEDRLWGGGNSSDPHRLYYSTLNSHEDFTGSGSGSISVYPGEGEKLVAAVSFKGLLITFKYPRGIYMVDTRDASPANWVVKPLTRAIGSVSAASCVVIDNDVMFLDASGGFQLISATQEFGDMNSRSISAMFEFNNFMRDNINFALLTKSQCIYYPQRREVHFLLAGSNAVFLNRRIVVDFNGETPRFRYCNRDMNHSIWLRKDINSVLRPMIGGNCGLVYFLDAATKTRDGGPFSSEFQTAHMDFSWLDPTLTSRKKIGQFLEVVFSTTGDWNINVDVMWDNKVYQTIQFNMGPGGGTVIGNFIIGESKLGGAKGVFSQRKRLEGSGQRLSLIGRNTGMGEDFSISRFFVYFKVGDEKIRGI